MLIPTTIPLGLAYAPLEAAVRAALVEHVAAAWAPRKIYHDPQEVADVAGSLPEASITLYDAAPDEEESSLSVEAIRLEYLIRLKAAKPTAAQIAAGTSLHAQRLAQTEALRSRLTQSSKLHTERGQWNWEWLGDQLLPRSPEELEREVRNNWYSVSLMLAVIVRPDLYVPAAPLYQEETTVPDTRMAGGFTR